VTGLDSLLGDGRLREWVLEVLDPHRDARLEKRPLGICGRFLAEVRVGASGGHAAPRSAFDQPGLEQERLVGVLDRLRLLADGDGEGREPDWPAAEQQALAQQLAEASGATPQFEPDARIRAGLKVAAGGNVVDGTLDGLLAERSSLEARLLRLLEAAP